MKERKRGVAGRRSTSAAATSAAPAWLAPLALAAVPVLLGLAWLLDTPARDGRLAFPMDDPYIHFRFAQNLARGAGFAFNPGEPTPGATSPLWVVLLAVTKLAGVAPETAALALGMAAAGGAVWLTWSVGRHAGLSATLAAIAALGVGLSGRFAWASLSGMETSLATVLVLATLRVQLAPRVGLGRAALTGLVAGLAAQARPEALLLGPLAMLTEWRAGRAAGAGPRGEASPPPALARVAALALAFLAVCAPYAIFCLATTGRPFPNTFYAKSLVPLAGPDLPALRAAYLPGMWAWIWRDNALFALLVLPGLVLWPRRAQPSGAALVWLWPVAFWIYALALYPRHFSLSRYTIPLLPCIALVAMAPVEALARRLGAGAGRLLAAIAVVVLASSAALGIPRAREVYRANVDNIVRMHLAMGAWIDAHLPGGARIAMNDVGAMTYVSGRYCIDTVGLVSGDLIDVLLAWKRAHGVAYGEDVLPAYFARTRPDYCVLFPVWYPQMTRAPWLREIHRISVPNSTGGGNDLVVYQVVGTPGPVAGPQRAGPAATDPAGGSTVPSAPH